jgi:type I restriction-modification system DNA methylase subunit
LQNGLFKSTKLWKYVIISKEWLTKCFDKLYKTGGYNGMTDTQQKSAAKAFSEYWKGKGYEKGESQSFWLSLLRDIYGIEHPEQFITFEEQVHLDHTSFIDGSIPSTKVLIEQKGLGKDLNKAIKQSDGTFLTPFQQAKRYITELPVSQHPRWVVTCNFAEFYIYDMERPSGEPEKILLSDLEKEYYRLQFLVDTGNEHLKREMEVSIAAGEIVGLIYDAFYKQYEQPVSEQDLKDLNVLCVRLVFCLYAENAGIFGKHGMFHDYLEQFDTKHTRKALKELFEILDTKVEDREKYLEEDIAAFPYVNGGLFAREDVVIPQFTDEIRELLLTKASADFDWSEISPTIFGAVFESTLNPETRRSGGMHYTSIENIHKVIDPLFLNDLKKELEEIKEIAVVKTRNKKLHEFQDKLASLKFLDPACGSGNFLTETYLSIRRLENETIKLITGGQMVLGEMLNPVKVSISQFYGIEINDFAVTVGKTALWIAESQMLKETEDIVHMQLDFLPLKTNAYIVEGNALKIDWESVVPKSELNYIMGNPPFVGARYMTKDQKDDLLGIFGKDWKNAGNLDYVTCWHKKTADLINGTNIKAALVSTNSIVQGEAVADLWKPLFDMGVHIDFAHRTFRWDSEAKLKAHVHCVIIGFSTAKNIKQKLLYTSDRAQVVNNINGYLLDAENIFIDKRQSPISEVPPIRLGGQAIDDGNFILTEEEKDELLRNEPSAEQFIRPYMMGKDFIDRKPRYCIWLVNANPAEVRKCHSIMERVQNVEKFRLASQRTSTLRAAQTPMLFATIVECENKYVAIPKVSSENRRYIPMDFLSGDIIPGDKLFTMSDASLYHFGVLTSNVHMSWMRAICGRLKSDYSYSNTIVYNNFPWCTPTEEQKAKIEQTAQGILDARKLYPDNSLADLYDAVAMPPELRKAHQLNDKAVMQAYGFPIKDFTESDCVAELMKMYQKYTQNQV